MPVCTMFTLPCTTLQKESPGLALEIILLLKTYIYSHVLTIRGLQSS